MGCNLQVVRVQVPQQGHEYIVLDTWDLQCHHMFWFVESLLHQYQLVDVGATSTQNGPMALDHFAIDLEDQVGIRFVVQQSLVVQSKGRLVTSLDDKAVLEASTDSRDAFSLQAVDNFRNKLKSPVPVSQAPRSPPPPCVERVVIGDSNRMEVTSTNSHDGTALKSNQRPWNGVVVVPVLGVAIKLTNIPVSVVLFASVLAILPVAPREYMAIRGSSHTVVRSHRDIYYVMLSLHKRFDAARVQLIFQLSVTQLPKYTKPKCVHMTLISQDSSMLLATSSSLDDDLIGPQCIHSLWFINRESVAKSKLAFFVEPPCEDFAYSCDSH
mmetsp:Transcript_15531/g.21644  ORF Transcript_15531/g.21644 Transcript_15531/m.21644 type:complete len:326 (+) Transcript_15531:51-1028(+)